MSGRSKANATCGCSLLTTAFLVLATTLCLLSWVLRWALAGCR